MRSVTSRGKSAILRVVFDAFLRGVTFDASDPVKVYFVKLIAVSRKLNERANGRTFARQNHSNDRCDV